MNKLLLKIKRYKSYNIFYRENTADELIVNNDYQTYRFFPDNIKIKPNGTILDIGAHIGIFTLNVSQKVNKGRIYAIEPNRENFEILKKNVVNNNLMNIEYFQLAISYYNGKGKLYLSDENWGHSLKFENVENSCEEVDLITLENFIANNNLNYIDFMKMNVEGAEYDIIYSTPQNIIKQIKAILIEFHPCVDHSSKELSQYIKECGFSIEIKYDKLNYKKGWITAFNKN